MGAVRHVRGPAVGGGHGGHSRSWPPSTAMHMCERELNGEGCERAEGEEAEVLPEGRSSSRRAEGRSGVGHDTTRVQVQVHTMKR